jgi:hypothetical protein
VVTFWKKSEKGFFGGGEGPMKWLPPIFGLQLFLITMKGGGRVKLAETVPRRKKSAAI